LGTTPDIIDRRQHFQSDLKSDVNSKRGLSEMTAEGPREHVWGGLSQPVSKHGTVCVCSKLLRDALNPDGCFSFQQWPVTAASCFSLPSLRLYFGGTHCRDSRCNENTYNRVEWCRRRRKVQEIVQQRLSCCICCASWRHVLGSHVLSRVEWEVVMVSEHLLCF